MSCKDHSGGLRSPEQPRSQYGRRRRYSRTSARTVVLSDCARVEGGRPRAECQPRSGKKGTVARMAESPDVAEDASRRPSLYQPSRPTPRCRTASAPRGDQRAHQRTTAGQSHVLSSADHAGGGPVMDTRPSGGQAVEGSRNAPCGTWRLPASMFEQVAPEPPGRVHRSPVDLKGARGWRITSSI